MDTISIEDAYQHQIETTNFINSNSRCLITSDPGTGKTRAVLDAIDPELGATLVLAPLSILEASWVEDIIKFTPKLKYGVAYAKNRKKIFEDTSYDIVITNFEAVNFLHKNPLLLSRFNTISLTNLLLSKIEKPNAQRTSSLLSIILIIELLCLVLLIVILF